LGEVRKGEKKRKTAQPFCLGRGKGKKKKAVPFYCHGRCKKGKKKKFPLGKGGKKEYPSPSLGGGGRKGGRERAKAILGT